jgi:hypothetical protein
MERKMSQFRDGSLGRLENHEEGIPVYWSAERIPDFGGWGGGNEEVDGGDGAELMPACQCESEIQKKKIKARVEDGPDLRKKRILFHKLFLQRPCV